FASSWISRSISGPATGRALMSEDQREDEGDQRKAGAIERGEPDQLDGLGPVDPPRGFRADALGGAARGEIEEPMPAEMDAEARSRLDQRDRGAGSGKE